MWIGWVIQDNPKIFATGGILRYGDGSFIVAYASFLDDCETNIDAKGYANMPSCMGYSH